MSVLEAHLILDPLPVYQDKTTYIVVTYAFCNPCARKTPKVKATAVVSLRLFDIKLCRDCALDLQNDLVGTIEKLSVILR